MIARVPCHCLPLTFKVTSIAGTFKLCNIRNKNKLSDRILSVEIKRFLLIKHNTKYFDNTFFTKQNRTLFIHIGYDFVYFFK